MAKKKETRPTPMAAVEDPLMYISGSEGGVDAHGAAQEEEVELLGPADWLAQLSEQSASDLLGRIEVLRTWSEQIVQDRQSGLNVDDDVVEFGRAMAGFIAEAVVTLPLDRETIEGVYDAFLGITDSVGFCRDPDVA